MRIKCWGLQGPKLSVMPLPGLTCHVVIIVPPSSMLAEKSMTSSLFELVPSPTVAACISCRVSDLMQM